MTSVCHQQCTYGEDSKACLELKELVKAGDKCPQCGCTYGQQKHTDCKNSPPCSSECSHVGAHVITENGVRYLVSICNHCNDRHLKCAQKVTNYDSSFCFRINLSDARKIQLDKVTPKKDVKKDIKKA
eukprot:TRINITY_DN571_c0_g1_i1.p2 TRINITY_DN571_c0_g1~~TRINITY_DN571_c0_g1_i1.p2  ORF type:complete len:128 (-),score=21.54 TRINITY_DN571_c0_g1_i1:363-746(-)